MGKGFRSVNVQLRQEFELFACVRPCKTYPGVRTFFSNVPIDLVLVRENTEDLYAGIEFEAGEETTAELIEYINRVSADKKIKSPTSHRHLDQAHQRPGSERIVRYAFEYARANGPEEGHRGPQGEHHEAHRRAFLGTARKVAEDFIDIEFEDRIVDNMCMQLVRKPEALRCAGAAQLVWRHHQRRGRRAWSAVWAWGNGGFRDLPRILQRRRRREEIIFWSSQTGTNGLGDEMATLAKISEVKCVRLTDPQKLLTFDINAKVNRNFQQRI